VSVETVAKRIREKTSTSDLDEVVELINRQKVDELKRLTIERMLAEERAKLEEARKKVPPDTAAAAGILGSIMQVAQVDPARAKEFLSSLSEEDILKLSMLTSSSQAGGILSLIPLLKSGSVGVKDIVEIVKMINPQPQPSIDLKGLAEIFKAGMEAAKSTSNSPADTLTAVMNIVKPFYELLSEKDRELWNERIRALESRIVDPVEYLKTIKSSAQELGLAAPSGGDTQALIEIERLRTERDLKLQELQQSFERWRVEQQMEVAKWDRVKDMLQGPLGQTLRAVGAVAASRVGGARVQAQFENVKCPSCGNTFPVMMGQDRAVCPFCKTILERAGGVEAEQRQGGGQQQQSEPVGSGQP
jgi:ribosomal protein S27E